MTEQFKLPVFFSYYQDSELKIVFVCEDENEEASTKLSEIAQNIFRDLEKQKLIDFIKTSEQNMFK